MRLCYLPVRIGNRLPGPHRNIPPPPDNATQSPRTDARPSMGAILMARPARPAGTARTGKLETCTCPKPHPSHDPTFLLPSPFRLVPTAFHAKGCRIALSRFIRGGGPVGGAGPVPGRYHLHVIFRSGTRHRSHGIPTHQGCNHSARVRFEPRACCADH